MSDQHIPKQVGRFVILELMHSTVCGTLYRVRAAGNDHEFALLLANAAAVANPSAASSFPARAQAASHFSHVNVARISEIGEADGALFVASELPPGRGLDKLRWRGAAGRETALHILAQLATALDAAHEAGLFHGSLTPDEVWIGPNPAGTDRWHVTLLGLGLSWPDDGAGGGGRHDHECLAPERRNPDRWAEVDAASDIYGYAAIAWRLLGLHMTDRGPDPTPAALRKALAPALADDPRMRPVRADAVFAAIRNALAPPTASLLPGTSEEGTGGMTLPVAQVLGLSAIAVMLVMIVLLAGQRLFPRFNAGSAGGASQTGDPPGVQIAQSTQITRTGSTGTLLLNTPVDPTNTPEPSATPSATATPLPTATHTPRPTPTAASTPTRMVPAATPVPAPTHTTVAVRTAAAVAVVPSLSSPPTGAAANGRVTFSWVWKGAALAANQGFEVRIWKQGHPDHYGAASPVRETSQEIDLGTAYGIQTGGGGIYFWTVALVQLDPYARIGQEATPHTLVVSFGGSADDGGGPSQPPSPPTVPPEPH